MIEWEDRIRIVADDYAEGVRYLRPGGEMERMLGRLVADKLKGGFEQQSAPHVLRVTIQASEVGYYVVADFKMQLKRATQPPDCLG